MAVCHDTIDKLQTAWIKVYQASQDMEHNSDLDIKAREIMKALEELVFEIRLRYLSGD